MPTKKAGAPHTGSHLWRSICHTMWPDTFADDMLTELQAEDIHAHSTDESVGTETALQKDNFSAQLIEANGDRTAIAEMVKKLQTRRQQQVGFVLHCMRSHSDLLSTTPADSRRRDASASQLRTAILGLHRLCYISSLSPEYRISMHHPICRGKVGETILHIAYLFELYDIAKFILEIDPSMVACAYQEEPYAGETVLHILAAQGGPRAEEACRIIKDLCLDKPGSWLYPPLSKSDLDSAGRYSQKLHAGDIQIPPPTPVPAAGSSNSGSGEATSPGFSSASRHRLVLSGARSQAHEQVSVFKQLYRQKSWLYLLQQPDSGLAGAGTSANESPNVAEAQQWCKDWARSAWIRLVNSRARGRFFMQPPVGTCFYGNTPVSIAAVLGHTNIVRFLVVDAGDVPAAASVAAAAPLVAASSTGSQRVPHLKRMASQRAMGVFPAGSSGQHPRPMVRQSSSSREDSRTDPEPQPSPHAASFRRQGSHLAESVTSSTRDRFEPAELQMSWDPTVCARLDEGDTYGNSAGHMTVYCHVQSDIFYYIAGLYHHGYGRQSTVSEYYSPAAQWARAVRQWTARYGSASVAQPASGAVSAKHPSDKLFDLPVPLPVKLNTFRSVPQCITDTAALAHLPMDEQDVKAFLTALAQAGILKMLRENWLEQQNLSADLRASSHSLGTPSVFIGHPASIPPVAAATRANTPASSPAAASSGAGLLPADAVPIQVGAASHINPMRLTLASIPERPVSEVHVVPSHAAHHPVQQDTSARTLWCSESKYNEQIKVYMAEMAAIMSKPHLFGPQLDSEALDSCLSALIAECATELRKYSLPDETHFERVRESPSLSDLQAARDAYVTCYTSAVEAMKRRGASSGERAELIDLVNDEGLTPLTLAAQLGKKALFESLLRGLGRPTWAWGDVRAVCIPLEQVDDIGHVADPYPDLVREVYLRDRQKQLTGAFPQEPAKGSQVNSSRHMQNTVTAQRHYRFTAPVNRYPTALAVAVQKDIWQLFEPRGEALARLAREGHPAPLPRPSSTGLQSEQSPWSGTQAGPMDKPTTDSGDSAEVDDLNGGDQPSLGEDESLLLQLVERKWNRVYRAQFRWLMLRRAVLISFAWCTAIVRSEVPDNAKPVLQCATNGSVSCRATQVLVPLLLIGQCLLLLIGVAQLERSTRMFRRICSSLVCASGSTHVSKSPADRKQWSRGMTAFSVSHTGSFGLYHTITLAIAVVFTIAATATDLALGWPRANILYAIAGASGGAHMIWFLVGFGHTGPLLIMLGQVMARQFTRWLNLFVPTIMVFAYALFVLDSLPAGQGSSSGFMSYMKTYMLGAIDASFNPEASAAIVEDRQGAARAYGMATENVEAGRVMYLLFYLALLFISFVALLSLLIALLSHAFTEYLSTPKARWRIERARACILLETYLSPEARLKLPTQHRYFVWLPHSSPGQTHVTLAAAPRQALGMRHTSQYKPYFFSQTSFGQLSGSHTQHSLDGKPKKE